MPTNLPSALTSYTLDPYGYVRREAGLVSIGSIVIGRNFPIRVAATLHSSPDDPHEAVREAIALVKSGCEIVRRQVLSLKHAEALKPLRLTLLTSAPLAAVVAGDFATTIEAIKWADYLAIYSHRYPSDELAEITEASVQSGRSLEFIITSFNAKPLVPVSIGHRKC